MEIKLIFGHSYLQPHYKLLGIPKRHSKNNMLLQEVIINTLLRNPLILLATPLFSSGNVKNNQKVYQLGKTQIIKNKIKKRSQISRSL